MTWPFPDAASRAGATLGVVLTLLTSWGVLSPPAVGGFSAMFPAQGGTKLGQAAKSWRMGQGGSSQALSSSDAGKGAGAGGLKRESLSVAFTEAAFQNVNRNDAEAAMKTFARTVGRRFGYLVQPTTQVFEQIRPLEIALQDGSVQLAILDVWRYLSMDVAALPTPVLTSMEQGKVGKRYVVLTRRGRGFKTLADLKGAEIMEFETTNFTLGRFWLETLLMEGRLGSHQTFFRRLEKVGKPSTAVLPVFFGKKDACLVDLSGFEVMKELNPQVGAGLEVVAMSEVLVDGVICVSKKGWSSETYQRDVLRTLGELHLDAGGKQILTLFKVDQLIPFEETHLETVRRLRKKYDELRLAEDQ